MSPAPLDESSLSEREAMAPVWLKAWLRFVPILRARRWPLLGLTVALTLAAGVAGLRLDLDPDPTEVFPSSVPEVGFWKDMRARFGGFDILMVGLREPGPGMSVAGLASLKGCTDALAELKTEGVLWTRSVSNVDAIKDDGEGGLDTDLRIPTLPGDAAEVAALSELLLQDRQVLGSLIGRDLRSYLILLRTDPRKDTRLVAERVRETVEARRGTLEAVYFGAPFVTGFLTRQVYAKLAWLAPLFVGLLLGLMILWIGPRRLGVVAVALGATGLALVWWLGLLYLAGETFTTTSLSAALLLVVFGAVLFARGAERAQEAMAQAGPQQAASSPPPPIPSPLMPLMAALAFALAAGTSLGVGDLVPHLARTARLTAWGLLAISLVHAIAFVPLLSFLRSEGPASATRDLRARPRMNLWLATGLGLLVLLFGLVARDGLRVYNDVRDIFLPDDEVGQALAFFDEHFGGANMLQVHLEGDLRDPAVTARLLRLSDLLEGAPGHGGPVFSDVRSVAQVVAFLGKTFDGLTRIPADRRALANLWFFLEGSPDIRPLVSADRDEAMLAARIPRGPGGPASAIARTNRAVERSADPGEVGAVHRLRALSYRYGQGLEESQIRATVADALRLEDGPTAAARQAAALERLKAFLSSDESLAVPSEAEWAALVPLVRDPRQARRDELTRGILAWEELIEGVPPEHRPELAKELADTLVLRFDGDLIEERTRDLVARLRGEGADEAPIAFVERARGVFADLLDPPRAAADVQIIVSGQPLIAPVVEARLKSGLLRALQVLWWCLGALAWLVTWRSSVALRLMGEAALVSAGSFGLAWATGLHADTSSIVLFLLAPTLPFLLSDRAFAPFASSWQALRGNNGVGVALALAAAGLSLVLTGVPPVMRLGGAMAIVLVVAALVAWLSPKLRTRLEHRR